MKYLSLNLSKTMLEVVAVMKEHDGKLIRWKHGFWTYEGAISKYDEMKVKYPNFYEKGQYLIPHSIAWDNMEHAKLVPVWDCDVKTLRALEKRGLVSLDEEIKVCTLIK